MATPPGGDALEEIAIGAALSGTVVGGIAGLVIAALSKRLLGNNAVAAFVGICVVGLIVYGVFTFSATEELASGIWLNLMHIVAAIPIVGLLVPATTSPNANRS